MEVLMNSTRPFGRIQLVYLALFLAALPAIRGFGRSEENAGSAPAPGAEQDLAKRTDRVRADTGLLQGVIIMGSVVREDGSPPPFGVVIERNCGDGYKKEVETDASGFFSFQIGRTYNTSLMFPDDESGSSDMLGIQSPGMITAPMPQTSAIRMAACELRAMSPGYLSGAARLTIDAATLKIDIGTIVLYPTNSIKGRIVGVTNLEVPKAARKAVDRAHKALGKKNYADAGKWLKSAVEIHPQYAEAWFWLGWLHEELGRYQESRAAFEKSIDADKNYARPLIGLAQLAGFEQKWREMADFSERAFTLEPRNFPEAYFLNALAYYRMNNLDAAERSVRKEQQVDKLDRIVKIHLLLAEILFQRNDLKGSLQEMRNYLKLAPQGPDVEAVRTLLRRRESGK